MDNQVFPTVCKPPISGAFRYSVDVYVELSLDDARFLKHIAEVHYDYRVRESAAGGVINGFMNLARWRADDEADGTLHAEPNAYQHACTTQQIDIVVKALEQWSQPAERVNGVALWDAHWARAAAERLTAFFEECVRKCYARGKELREGKS